MTTDEFVEAVNDVYKLRKFNAVCTCSVNHMTGNFEFHTTVTASDERYSVETFQAIIPAQMPDMDESHASVLAGCVITHAKELTFHKLFAL